MDIHGLIAGGGRGGFIPAETLVHNGTAGDNDNDGGTLTQQVQENISTAYKYSMKPLMGNTVV